MTILTESKFPPQFRPPGDFCPDAFASDVERSPLCLGLPRGDVRERRLQPARTLRRVRFLFDEARQHIRHILRQR